MEQAVGIAELDHRFGIPEIVKIVAGNGGLTKVEVTSRAAQGEMYLHGAHVTSWKPWVLVAWTPRPWMCMPCSISTDEASVLPVKPKLFRRADFKDAVDTDPNRRHDTNRTRFPPAASRRQSCQHLHVA